MIPLFALKSKHMHPGSQLLHFLTDFGLFSGGDEHTVMWYKVLC